jgi:hypothetical protein
MSTNLVIQVGSTFVCNRLAELLPGAFADVGLTASVRVTAPTELSQHLVSPTPDTEDVAGTMILCRVEDWLREIAAGADDKAARRELKTRLDEFLGQVSVLAMRGRPVWLVVCPSTGWIAEKYNLAALCRTYTNLLAARLRNLPQITLLAWPELLSGDEFLDREQDRANHTPFTPAAIEKLAETLASQLARFLAAGNSTEVTFAASAGSSELASFLSGLHVRVEVAAAKAGDGTDVGRILRTAASFSLTGEKPTLPEPDVEDLVASENCWLVTVSDRLSNHGPTGVVVARASDGALLVDTMSLSCTVLGRQVEYALLVALQQVAVSRELPAIVFEYKDGGRNQPMLSFLKLVAKTDRGGRFALPVDQVERRIGEAAVAPSAWSLTLRP